MACLSRGADKPWVYEGVGGLLVVGMSAGRDVGCLLAAGVLQGMGVGVCWSLVVAGDLRESNMDAVGWR